MTQYLSKLSLFFLLLSLIWLTACRRSPNQITIEVDQETIELSTQAQTVRQALAEADVTLNDLDRVRPDLNYQLSPVMIIEVIRVTQATETITNTLPYGRQIVVNEGLEPGSQRLAQLGSNGLEQISTQITYENGEVVERLEVERVIIQPAVDEILIVGRQSDLPSVSVAGVLSYLSGGNAWLIRNSSGTRRPLTTSSDLDGRVLSLSPEGSQLIYSRNVTAVINAPLNELWMVDTRIVGEPPISLPVQGVLYAEWSPVVSQSLIVYSTAERVPSQPGWRANNDLWLWDVRQTLAEATQIISPNTSSLYPWWGHFYTWSPTGEQIAFATANQIGVIDLISQTQRILLDFPPLETNSDWVWVPQVDWSPDGRFLAAVIHGPPLQNEAPTLSPRFDLWLLSADGSLQVEAVPEVGMWSNPIWHAGGIVYGQADNPRQSLNSPYSLQEIDWDGSNPRVLYPNNGEPGVAFPQMAWLDSDIVFVAQENLQLLTAQSLIPQTLTSDSQSHQPQWRNTGPDAQLFPLAPSLSISQTQSLTATQGISSSGVISSSNTSVLTRTESVSETERLR